MAFNAISGMVEYMAAHQPVYESLAIAETCILTPTVTAANLTDAIFHGMDGR